MSWLNDSLSNLYKWSSSTVSFKDAGSAGEQTAYGLADDIASNPTSHYNKVETTSKGGYYTSIVGGVSNGTHFHILMFTYNQPWLYLFYYRDGTYYVTTIGGNRPW